MGNSEHQAEGVVLEGIRRHWDRQARGYDRSMGALERLVFAGGREWVCSRVRGRTLEVAVGTGRNLACYPPGTELSGIDLSSEMLAVARRRARDLGIDADLREGDAQRLPYADASFDTVVCTLSLCSVPDMEAVIAEMYRVVRPGGVLLLFDHVRPTFAPLRWFLLGVQGLVNLLEPGNGEQMMRRPLPAVRAQGFVIGESERTKGGMVERLAARRPA
ncbi:class I SAM-dependent methyltransferase [Nocardiopsis tropica]|uniref:Class I SAM-dependent methyltransferase n=1 Tax=Nocardiopsis tropica TaxID=109330 RepID=A0ABU7KK67_9ACTN|nr:class I SAM-dependent methyltransferase [Nocardiopsis umidischolae]MEE2049690.1 class I SAM-dependent methyltransferase [Nocardiopsis umidischolae]